MNFNVYGRRGPRINSSGMRYPVKKVSRELVLEVIRNELKERIRVYTESLGKQKVLDFPAEELAERFQFKLSKVQWALHRLNLEGIVSQGFNQKPHDIERSRYCCPGEGYASGWNSTLYRLTLPRTFPLKPPTILELQLRPFPISLVPKGCFPVRKESVLKKKPKYSKRTHRRASLQESV